MIKQFSKITESAGSNKFKLGLDIHGVIDSLPEVFSFLSKAVVDAGGEVHILTGSKIEQAKEELKKYNITYTHLFSIQDYHEKLGTPTKGTHPKYGFPMIDDDAWDLTKGDYCRKHNISIHIDDTLVYNENFTTPFARLWSHTGTPKVNKDTRHLD